MRDVICGARKGMADTALKTADSGYNSSFVERCARCDHSWEADCGSGRGLTITAIKGGNEVIETRRTYVRTLRWRSVKHPETGEVSSSTQ